MRGGEGGEGGEYIKVNCPIKFSRAMDKSLHFSPLLRKVSWSFLPWIPEFSF